MATVPSIISDQQAYAAGWVAQANAFIDRVADLANTTITSVPVVQAFNYTDIAASALTLMDARTPVKPTFNTVSAVAPTAPTFTFTDLIPVTILDFLATMPEINIPNPPSSLLPGAPSAPTINDVTVPDAPTILLPDAPTIMPVAGIPPAPSIELPLFSSELPIDDLITPTNEFSFFEEVYSSVLLDELKAKLLDALENGGYGIEPNDEAGVWERARVREQAAADQAINDAVTFQAIRGFRLPPGEMSVVVQRGQQDLQDKLSGLSRDIAIKRADQFVENRKFSIEQSRELENITIQYHNSVMERALNASRAIFDFSIAVFNAQVSKYNVKVQAYQAEAQVFESKMRASMIQVEIYRAILEGRRTEIMLEQSKVDLYRAQIDAVNSVVSIYRTRMDAARIQGEIEANRLNVFRSMVEAYGQQIQAKVAEFGMYRSQIEGETAKLQGFRAQVDAYGAQVNAARARVEVQTAQVTMETERARSLVLEYQAQLDGYKADLTSQVQVLQSQADIYRADISAFTASIDAIRSSLQLRIEEGRNNLDSINHFVDASAKTASLQLQALESTAKIRLSAATFGSEFYGNMVSSTLGSITTLAAQTQAA